MLNLGIGQFFKKIRGKYEQEIFLRTVIKEAIQSQSRVIVSLGSVNYKNGTVILADLTQTARSQIFIKKQAIIEQINNQQKVKKVIDIKA